MAEMSSTLTAESKKYATVAKDLHRQASCLSSAVSRRQMWTSIMLYLHSNFGVQDPDFGVQEPDTLQIGTNAMSPDWQLHACIATHAHMC